MPALWVQVPGPTDSQRKISVSGTIEALTDLIPSGIPSLFCLWVLLKRMANLLSWDPFPSRTHSAEDQGLAQNREGWEEPSRVGGLKTGTCAEIVLPSSLELRSFCLLPLYWSSLCLLSSDVGSLCLLFDLRSLPSGGHLWVQVPEFKHYPQGPRNPVLNETQVKLLSDPRIARVKAWICLQGTGPLRPFFPSETRFIVLPMEEGQPPAPGFFSLPSSVCRRLKPDPGWECGARRNDPLEAADPQVRASSSQRIFGFLFGAKGGAIDVGTRRPEELLSRGND
ncbi:uncharacterized protein [Notamacropus eugenii]|uniref:uncharacterized protein n=1 Tax=Notamacropus eugenii TaxID=9315 RepID=UPI003B672947